MTAVQIRKVTDNLPLLSMNERRNRWRRVREGMTIRELDCLLVFSSDSWWGASTANLRYLTQLAIPGSCVFPLDGEPVVFAGLAHLVPYIAMSTNWVQDVRSGKGALGIAEVLKEKGLGNKKIGVVGFGRTSGAYVLETVPYKLFDELLKLLPLASFQDASSLLEEIRMVKSEEELGFLQKASDLAFKMYEAVLQTVRPGVMECEVVANMLQAEISNGGEYSMILMDSGNPPLLHARNNPPTTTRRLEKGDIILTEWHSNYGGYLAANEHSFSLGEPKKEFREIHSVCEEVFKSGTSAMFPGAALSDVGNAFIKPIKDAGMNYIECGLHGHGLYSPDFPALITSGIPVYKKTDSPTEELFERESSSRAGSILLRENMVFGTNIDVFNPKFNPSSGLMLGDMVSVTNGGAKKMSKIPLQLSVVGQ